MAKTKKDKKTDKKLKKQKASEKASDGIGGDADMVASVAAEASRTGEYAYKVGSTREEEIDYRKSQIHVEEVCMGFAVERVVQLAFTGEVVNQYHRVVLMNTATDLRTFVQDATVDRASYRTPAILQLTRLLGQADTLEEYRKTMQANYAETKDEDYLIDPASGIDAFVDYLLEKTEAIRAEYHEMVGRGVISFDMLSAHFRPGTRVVFGEQPNLEGAMVISGEYGTGWTGPYFKIAGQRYASDGKNFGKSEDDYRIPMFGGTVPLDDLPIRIAKDAEIVQLSRRGAIWAERIHSPQYLNYTGKIARKMGWFTVYTTANGRCMIDPAMHGQMNHSFGGNELSVDATMTTLPDAYTFTAPAFVNGFSLSKKAWGSFAISGLTEIDFRDDAYDLLVLDPDVKSEVRALVQNSDDMFTDIISGKGGGAIFLLHGTPGLGKTLTAESVAEILHRPLYSISVGELGITPDQVEAKLQEVLEMVMSWNAVLLLDEADIFLEARSKDDILRNSMVGVFLRMLEYHNGVLFMTTNRVNNFDPAVLSRISVILKYPDFTPEIRTQVWTNILSAAGLGDMPFDYEYMSVTYDVNGRQIKNAIRIAMSLASSRGLPPSQELIEGSLRRMVSVLDHLGETPAEPVQQIRKAS